MVQLSAEVTMLVVPSATKVTAGSKIELVVYLMNGGEEVVEAPISRLSEGNSVGNVGLQSSFFTLLNGELENIGGGGGWRTEIPARISGLQPSATRIYKYQYKLPEMFDNFSLVELQVLMRVGKQTISRKVIFQSGSQTVGQTGENQKAEQAVPPKSDRADG